ncbi:transcriptional regulatory protein NOT1 [Trypanosoma rangeli SC58]|uniref:Transcriptional regulatory protein NOT1 n=1 Tax=Trypanosoma rangeli SC58 TaxID=429131 RepID=A0A061IW19_TRYRA|nr:transcriptional regulatory protein NOT1 [Trypanosoma rangeli SC58]
MALFPVVEAAVHVASRDRKFDMETLRPAAERYPLLLFSILLFGTFPGTVKNFSTAKLILKERWLALDRVAAVVLPESEKRGRLDTVVMVLSELTIVDPSCTIEVMETVLKSKTAVKAFLASGGNPRLVTAIAMCVDDAAEPGDTWISKALEGKLHFRANAAENRFAVAMSIVEVAEQLIIKQKYVSNATAALNIFLASSLKDVLRDVAEQARALLASSDSLFPSDVENDANEFYRRMYAMGDPTNAASLAFIEQLRKSSKARDKQLYACILSIMFEEHSAIGCYPHKELQTFAVLYGQMIARELLPHNQQQHAWGLLLPTIVKPKDHMVEECGIIALEQIKPRLAEWPQYGRALRHVKDLDIKIPGIMAAINRGIKAEEAARQQQNRQQPPPEKPVTKEAESLLLDPAVLAVSTERRDAMAAAADQHKERSAAATLHQHDIGTLLSSRNITAPPRVIQEQINFLIGNTDKHNIEHNASELAKQLRPEYYEYFAEYLVIKRAALEPNYHNIYLELLDKLQSKPLEKAIRSATVASIKRLLNSDKIRADPGERSLLKNLGFWLGHLTLAKNIPITVQDLCFKDLIFMGLREGKLMAVVSCVSRVLHHCMSSHFFCPPNPWTMRLLCLLWEMYNLKHLRVTLRFEVEVLCKHMNVTLKDIERYYTLHPISPAAQLCLSDVYKEINFNQSGDFRVDEKDVQESSPLMPSQQKTPPQQQQQQQPPPPRQTRQLQASAEPFKPKDTMPVANAMPSGDSVVPSHPAIHITPESVRISDEDVGFFANCLDAYRGSLVRTLEKIVQDAKVPLQRIVVVATVTACSIVTKDFLLDQDMGGMLRAGQSMARSLAANLCTVTVRDIMIEPFNKHVAVLAEHFIDASVPNAAERRDRLRTRVRENNMELCVRVLEYQAAEEAERRVHDKLMQTVREKLEAINAHEFPRIPNEYYAVQDVLMQMGEVLRPPRNVPPLQRAVYEEYRNNVPIVGLLTTYLSTIEETTVAHYSKDSCKTLSLTSPEFRNKYLEDSQDTIMVRVINISNMITSGTAFYCVGHLLSKLLALSDALKQMEANAGSMEPDIIRHKKICEFLNEVYPFCSADLP